MSTAIAILGGGITGLATAHHLARLLPPNARILLLEHQHRLGGWLKSTPLNDDNSDGRALESGPRTLRPNSLAIMELVCTQLTKFPTAGL